MAFIILGLVSGVLIRFMILILIWAYTVLYKRVQPMDWIWTFILNVLSIFPCIGTYKCSRLWYQWMLVVLFFHIKCCSCLSLVFYSCMLKYILQHKILEASIDYTGGFLFSFHTPLKCHLIHLFCLSVLPSHPLIFPSPSCCPPYQHLFFPPHHLPQLPSRHGLRPGRFSLQFWKFPPLPL